MSYIVTILLKRFVFPAFTTGDMAKLLTQEDWLIIGPNWRRTVAEACEGNLTRCKHVSYMIQGWRLESLRVAKETSSVREGFTGSSLMLTSDLRRQTPKLVRLDARCLSASE